MSTECCTGKVIEEGKTPIKFAFVLGEEVVNGIRMEPAFGKEDLGASGDAGRTVTVEVEQNDEIVSSFQVTFKAVLNSATQTYNYQVVSM